MIEPAKTRHIEYISPDSSAGREMRTNGNISPSSFSLVDTRPGKLDRATRNASFINKDRQWTQSFLLIAVFLLGFCGVSSAAAGTKLANEDIKGLYCRTFEQVLRLEDEQIDLATGALLLSAKWGMNGNIETYRGEIDDMAAEILKRLKKQKIPVDYRAIRVINHYLYEELGYKTVAEATDSRDLFLHNVIRKRKGYCLSLSILYLSIGERLGLPLYGVVVPGHFFVRYDDGKIRFNIEATSKGLTADDKHYIDKFRVPVWDEDDRKVGGIYLENLDKLQSLGCFLNNLGNCYSTDGEYDKAAEILELAVEINPALAEARTNLGNIYLRFNKPDMAIAQYLIALDIFDKAPNTLNNLGNAYRQKNELAKALDCYNAALGIDKNNAESLRNIAMIHMLEQRYPEAMAYINKAIAAAKDRFENYMIRADINRRSSNSQAAINDLRKAISLNKDSFEAHFNLGSLYFEANTNTKALYSLRQALRLRPDDTDCLTRMAMCYERLDQKENAIHAYGRLLEIAPDNSEARFNLGNLLMDMKKYDQAIEHYLIAAQTEPVNPLVFHNLGVAYSKLEDYATAGEYFTRAATLDPENGKAFHGLAICQYLHKEYQAAYENALTARELGIEVNDLIDNLKKIIEQERR